MIKTAGGIRGAWTRRYLIWPLEATLFIMVLALLATLPRRKAETAGGWLTSFLGARFSHQHARAMRRNIAVAFPHLTQSESFALQKRIWRHLGHVLSTYSHLPPLLRQPDLGGAVTVEGTDHLEAAAAHGRFLLVGAHFGHWEMAGCYAAMLGHKMTALYTPESNPLIDRLIRHLRQTASAESRLVPRGPNAVRRMMEALREGGGLFIIVDQRVDDGEWLPFFGVPARTTTTPARLARRFDCPIVPASTVLLENGRYRITYHEPLHPDPSRDADDDVREITLALNRMFETWIRQEPGQWLCLKRRWPKDKERAAAPPMAAAGAEPRVPAPAD
jgi:KDO2-lipid IV(A) lauroyltransferase